MSALIDKIHGLNKTSFPKHGTVLKQGEKKGALLFLCEGSVEVLRDGVRICKVSDRGAVFGEISVLLNVAQTATVRTLEPSTFFVIQEASKFLKTHPDLTYLLAKLLARRLADTSSYLLEIQKQFAQITHEA